MKRELSESLYPIFYIMQQLYKFKFVLETFQYNNLVKYDICNSYMIYAIPHFQGAVFGYPWKEGAVNLEIAKAEAVLCEKEGALVSQLVLKLKESVPPLGGIGKG